MAGIYSSWIPPILRPRSTWRYIVTASAVLYTTYCFLLGKPMLSSNLPKYSGLYAVGVIDVEVPVERVCLADATFKSTGSAAFELETVLCSIYYPAGKEASLRRAKHYWISKPIHLVAEGYARFAHSNNFITRGLFTAGLWLIAGSTEIPADVDVPLVEGDGSIPAVIFSHGMASSRTQYSAYLGELASHGYIVVAIEHRDGSGPATYISQPGEAGRVLLHFGLNDVQQEPPLDNAGFTRHQLAMRQAEVEATIRMLNMINEGQGDRVYEQNSRKEGRSLCDWQGRINVEQLIIAGHSYGATLAMQTLRGAPSSALPIRGCIALDPGKRSGPLNDDIDVPLLIVHSNSWSKSYSIFYSRPHFSVLKQIAESVLTRGKAAWFMTSLGTTHPSVTDAPLISPTLLKWATGATLHGKAALQQYVQVSLDFLQYVQTGRKEGALAVGVTHPEYDEHVVAHTSHEDGKQSQDVRDIAKYWQIHVAP